MWYRHTKNPISLINFLHASQKGPTLSPLNSISPLKTNFHLLIDVATQCTDRHFIDLSLTTAAWASGGNRSKKRNVPLQCGRMSLFFLLKAQILCGPSVFLLSARINSLFMLIFFCSHVTPPQHTNTGCSLILFSLFHTPTHGPQRHAKQPFDNSGKQIWWDFMRRCAIKLLSP